MLVAFDDGHHPGKSTVGTQLVVNQSKCEDFFMVFDGVLEEKWRDKAYTFALEHSKPWGAYVTMNDLDDVSINTEELFQVDPIQAIALQATRDLIFTKGKEAIKSIRDSIHGTAVWCLVSDEGSEVQYHIDYAELYRYETNIIHPPIIAATCHLSPILEDDITGGAFMVNTQGISHYAKFGYKAHLASKGALELDLISDTHWKTVTFKCNRGIMHTGSWPHLSTKIQKINNPGVKRVILGFNSFIGEAVGTCCKRAPEHSDAFNRTVKLYQAVSNVTIVDKYKKNKSMDDNTADVSKLSTKSHSSLNSREDEGKVSIRDLMKNKALSRLVVLAARKIKQTDKK